MLMWCRTHKQEVSTTKYPWGYRFACGCEKVIVRDLTDDPETWEEDEDESK
jgi:hypothetical protein